MMGGVKFKTTEDFSKYIIIETQILKVVPHSGHQKIVKFNLSEIFTPFSLDIVPYYWEISKSSIYIH